MFKSKIAFGAPLLPHTPMDGTHLHEDHFTLRCNTNPTPMTIAGGLDLFQNQWKMQGEVRGYNADIVRTLYGQNYWINRLASQGVMSFSGIGPVRAPAIGAGWCTAAFCLAQTDFQLPAGRRKAMSARGSRCPWATTQGGMAEVVWEKPADSGDAALTINVTSVPCGRY